MQNFLTTANNLTRSLHIREKNCFKNALLIFLYFINKHDILGMQCCAKSSIKKQKNNSQFLIKQPII